jgi:hypothetical protein
VDKLAVQHARDELELEQRSFFNRVHTCSVALNRDTSAHTSLNEAGGRHADRSPPCPDSGRRRPLTV